MTVPSGGVETCGAGWALPLPSHPEKPSLVEGEASPLGTRPFSIPKWVGSGNIQETGTGTCLPLPQAGAARPLQRLSAPPFNMEESRQ